MARRVRALALDGVGDDGLHYQGYDLTTTRGEMVGERVFILRA